MIFYQIFALLLVLYFIEEFNRLLHKKYNLISNLFPILLNSKSKALYNIIK